MRIPLDWVHEYVDSRLDASQASETLTMMGLEVEEVEDTGPSGSPVLDITVMSNRGDCLSMVGVARELAADEDLPLKVPSFEMQAEGSQAADSASIEIQDPDLCYRYAATVIKGITVGPSPEWMAKRLAAAGMRPINNVVDVTNYVMLETGQPLHAFDLDLLPEGAIVVRRAKPGEKITTLDDVERDLKPEMLAICDRSHPIAVAGVMGGSDTEVTQGTKNVLIESACFNGASVRSTARELGLQTEASYRFERNVDLGGTANAAIRAAELIRQLAGGTIQQGVVDVCPVNPEERTLTLRPERASALLGVELTAEQCAGYLNRLSLQTEIRDGAVQVTVPTFRNDVTQEVDLVEEVGRVFGFNNLPTTLITGPSLQGKDSRQGQLEAETRRILFSMGMQEVMTHSIVAQDAPAPEDVRPVDLRNALSADVARLRPTLLSGVAQVLAENFNRGVRDLAVFEIGAVFHSGENGPSQNIHVAGALIGSRWDNAWTIPDKKLSPEAFRRSLDADFYQAKGIVEGMLAQLGVENVEYTSGAAGYWRAGHAADVASYGVFLGQLGETSLEIRERLDLKLPAFGFEISLDRIAQSRQTLKQWQAASRYPAVKRDIAAIVDEAVTYRQLLDVIGQAASELVEDVRLFDVYRGEQIGAGMKSLGLSLVFRSSQKTLTDTEVSEAMSRILSALADELNAAFRE